jgi:predicted patatin/cPLA2 family phospholipase
VPDTLEILRERLRRGGRGPYEDGASVALAVEGGAMRGVVSAGMVSALEELGAADLFDAVYGSSAGAINAAYFLGGQARLGTTIYFEDINNHRFIDVRRALTGRPIVNLGFLLDDVAQRAKRLDVARVTSARAPLTVVATDVQSEQPCGLRSLSTREDLFSALRASATMPVLAGPPTSHQGRTDLDASLTEPIPVPIAETDGHTHILVLLTRGEGGAPRPSAFDRWFIEPRLRRLSPGLAARYMTRAQPYAELLQRIGRGEGPLRQAQVTAIRVTDYRISKLERRRSVLEEGAARGRAAVLTAFQP